MFTLSDTLVRIAKALEKQAVSAEQALVVMADVVDIFEYLKDGKITYFVAGRQVAALLADSNIA